MLLIIFEQCSNKGPYSQNHGFTSNRVWMWDLDHKKDRALKNWCFWTVVLEKTFDSPLDCKEIKPVSPKNQFSSVQLLSRVRLFVTPWIAAHQASLCPSPTPRVHSNSCPSSQWCHPAISSYVVPFSSCPQSLPASESFPMSQLFAWGGQSTGVSALATFLWKNTKDWTPLGWTGWISLQSKGLSRVFSNTTVQKHQFFSAQLSSQSNSHTHTTTGKTIALTRWTFVGPS